MTSREPISWPFISVKTLFWLCVGTEIVLVALDLATHLFFRPGGELPDIVNMTRETTLPSWLGTLQLLAVALVLVQIWRREPKMFLWVILAGFFLYMAVDDASKIHERVGGSLEIISEVLKFPSYTWQLVFAPLFGTMALVILMVWRRRFGWTRWGLLLFAGMACWALAVGIDYWEGLDVENIVAYKLGWNGRDLLHTSRVLEEVIEMFGTTLFLVSFTHYLSQHVNRISVELEEP